MFGERRVQHARKSILRKVAALHGLVAEGLIHHEDERCGWSSSHDGSSSGASLYWRAPPCGRAPGHSRPLHEDWTIERVVRGLGIQNRLEARRSIPAIVNSEIVDDQG